MKPSSKNIIAFSIIFILSISAVLCCCISSIAEANVVQYSKIDNNSSHCCPENKSSEKNNECRCQSDSELLAAASYKNIEARFATNKNFHLTSGFLTNPSQKSSRMRFSALSPKLLNNDPPIYLKNSTFRL